MLRENDEERLSSETPPDPPDTEDEDPEDGSGESGEDGSGDDSEDDSGGEDEDPVEKLRRENEDLRRKNQQYVAAERNRARRAAEAAGAEAPPIATRSSADEQRYHEAEIAARDLELQLRQIALEEKDPDPAIRRAAVAAKATLHLAASTQRQNVDTMAEISFLKMPSELQAAARAAWESGEFKTPQAALRAVKGDLYDSVGARPGKPKPKPRSGDDNDDDEPVVRRPRNYVGSSHRSVSAGEHRERKQKTSDFVSEAERLAKAGDMKGLRALDDEETSGKRRLLQD